MSTLKRGKLAPMPGAAKKSSEISNNISKEGEDWGKFVPKKSSTSIKKKEFKKGSGNVMIPADNEKKLPLKKTDSSLATDQYAKNITEPRKDLEFIEDNLKYNFKDRSLLSRSLTHRSALGIKERADYERLEFLGDAVLDLTVAHLLSDNHPDAREGELSKMRAALVNTQSLAQIARKLNLQSFIKLGRGEFSAGGADRPSILADVTEAVIGAVYRDSNYETVFELVERIFGSSLKEVTPFDPKTELQEVLHSAGSEPPSYLLELIEGPEHAPTFVTIVNIDGQTVAKGKGPTKKAAQQAAAAQALIQMIYDSKPVNLKEKQNFFIEDALLLANPTELKKKDVLQNIHDNDGDILN